jgi:hypothetical protein
MTYELLKDHEDKDYGLDLHVGDQFVPASVGYPQHKTDALVLNGTLKLLTKVPPTGTVIDEPKTDETEHHAKKAKK